MKLYQDANLLIFSTIKKGKYQETHDHDISYFYYRMKELLWKKTTFSSEQLLRKISLFSLCILLLYETLQKNIREKPSEDGFSAAEDIKVGS